MPAAPQKGCRRFHTELAMNTVKEIASKLKLSEAAIYRYVAAGRLECHRFGNAIRVSDEQLNDFLDRQKINSSESQLSVSTFRHL